MSLEAESICGCCLCSWVKGVVQQFNFATHWIRTGNRLLKKTNKIDTTEADMSWLLLPCTGQATLDTTFLNTNEQQMIASKPAVTCKNIDAPLLKCDEAQIWLFFCAQTLATTFDSAITMVPLLLYLCSPGFQCWPSGFFSFFFPFLGLFRLMDSFYILPLQMRMSVQETPVRTLNLAKIWLADITATVFGDGPDKTVTSVSISFLNTSKFLSFHWRPILLASFENASSHFQYMQHRCTL